MSTFTRRIPRRSFALAASDNVSSLGADDVAIKMTASPVTVNGTMSGAGVVTSVGSSVKNFSVDDVVFSQAPLGEFREVVKVSSKKLVKVSPGVPSEYASIIDAPCTAEHLLKDVKAGESIVQSGADSLVGQSVIQLAQARGITTINIVSSVADDDEMIALCSNIGGDVVCPSTYAVSHRFKDLVSDLPKPVLAIHSETLQDPKLTEKKLREVVETASEDDLLKLKVASVMSRLASKSVSSTTPVPIEQQTVDSVCEAFKAQQLHLWVEKYPTEDLDFVSEKVKEVAPGFRAPILSFN